MIEIGEKIRPVAGELRAWVKAAQEKAKAGESAAAEELLSAVVAVAPEFAPAAVALADLREANGDLSGAVKAVLALVENSPTQANVTAVARKFRKWHGQEVKLPGVALRVALTGHGTLDPLGDYLRVALAQEDFAALVFVSGFDLWAQDLLDPNSPLHEFRPDVIGIRLDVAALFPRTVGEASASAEVIAAERQAGIGRIISTWDAAGANAPGATMILHTFSIPDFAPRGMLDAMDAAGQRARIVALNADLAEIARNRPGRILLLDQERLEARHGKSRVRDERLWYLASMPFSESFLPEIARAYSALCRALKGRTKKCVVLDLDNTLWGGVIGEDGLSGIQIGGTSAPGNAFADFQRALLQLRERGILLAACSKNNSEDALAVFDEHPEMILRREHFAALRINWSDKARNIAEIARELNIGRDSLVFLDDNPAERAMVREALPEVLTVEMPPDPALYASTLRALDVFESVALTEEDRRRAALYAEQRERQEFAATLGVEETEMGTQTGGGATDLRSYLKGLEIVCTIAKLTEFAAPRVAQLIGKTNQFNVTTRRHTEANVRQMLAEPEKWGVWTIRVADKFGDSGLTGIAIARKGAEIWELDSFLLSCRVLGRGAEDALLLHVLQAARDAEAKTIRAVFLPTPKNAPADEFYAKQGLKPVPAWPDATNGGEATYYTLDTSEISGRSYPEWLTIREE